MFRVDALSAMQLLFGDGNWLSSTTFKLTTVGRVGDADRWQTRPVYRILHSYIYICVANARLD
jgi:hypothetical protein